MQHFNKPKAKTRGGKIFVAAMAFAFTLSVNPIHATAGEGEGGGVGFGFGGREYYTPSAPVAPVEWSEAEIEKIREHWRSDPSLRIAFVEFLRTGKLPPYISLSGDDARFF
jgi:hypothetical protein